MKTRRLRATIIVLTLTMATATCVLAPASRADQLPVCARPVWPNTPHTFPTSARVETIDVGAVPVNVLLPRDYATSGHRYPVLYILHGGAMWYGTWLALSDIVSFTGALADDQQAIIVMPDGGYGVYTDWNPGPSVWEQFHTGTLIRAIDERYRTIADRSHRAIAGESGGGLGATFYASRHPDLFVAAESISGAVDFGGIPVGLALSAVTTMVYATCPDGPDGGGMRPAADDARDEIWLRNGNPVDLARSLHGVSVRVTSGNGMPCDAADLQPMSSVYPALEPAALDEARRYDDALTNAGVEHTTQLSPCGTHAFRYFDGFLHDFWPQMLGAFGRPDPTTFDYRRADAAFSVWGWDFTADPVRAAEFLDITSAGRDGVSLTGSGRETVTTASYFAPMQAVQLSDGRRVTADSAGRLTFTVDLGAPHRQQQYTASERLTEQVVGARYWTTRTITFAAVP